MDEGYFMLWTLKLGTHVQVTMCTNNTYGTGMDACIAWWYITCIVVCVMQLCAGAHDRRKATRWLSAMAIDSECVVKKEAKKWFKDKYECLI